MPSCTLSFSLSCYWDAFPSISSASSYTNLNLMLSLPLGHPNHSALMHVVTCTLSSLSGLFHSPLHYKYAFPSISSVFSYTNSIVSSNFMLLSSTTNGSSAPSSLFDHNPHKESKTSAFSAQLKTLYHTISALQTKILAGSVSHKTRAVSSSRVAHLSFLSHSMMVDMTEQSNSMTRFSDS